MSLVDSGLADAVPIDEIALFQDVELSVCVLCGRFVYRLLHKMCRCAKCCIEFGIAIGKERITLNPIFIANSLFQGSRRSICAKVADV
ncbi:hypothetical protein Dbac_2710 [Desulfomicrobium baculatum DSM 4028]|uniref:Uncharacterized protein n=1 Tax=Desulfomicrobium baculatum (strain DSM 4028 / VKM B-1378 / X) TaxID=525897 RepID=C7LTM0_DESBD|nr:hypothetical protein Dbac_2710 [Desulfomicrobium baculatum DSM 4028]